VKMGALLAYETTAHSGEVHGKAIDFVKLKLAASDGSVKETRAGALEIDGLDAVESGQVRPLSFRVKQAVPIAYAVYPISDVCKFALPEPDVSPALVDFGDVAYGAESTRMLHVVNRAQVDLYAIHEARNFAVPARGSVDLPLTWRPRGEATGCDAQTREETVLFVPRDSAVATVPAQQSVRVVEHVRAGKPVVRQSEHVDTGAHRKPEYAKTAREWQCPNDYAIEACKTEHPACADRSGNCSSDGYGLVAQISGNGCKFGCNGPDALVSSQFCRFDAVMDCRLRCAK